MTPGQLDLLRAFFEQVDRTLQTSADMLERASTGKLSANEAARASTFLRDLADQSRAVRRMVMNPPEPSIN
jgi:hypothetical protein